MRGKVCACACVREREKIKSQGCLSLWVSCLSKHKLEEQIKQRIESTLGLNN